MEQNSGRAPLNINYETVTKISVSYGGFLGRGIYLKIDCVTGQATLTTSDGENFMDPIELDVQQFTRELCEIVSIWETKMVNNGILDGIFYYVSIECQDGAVYEYTGRNAFPSNFDCFLSLLRSYGLLNAR